MLTITCMEFIIMPHGIQLAAVDLGSNSFHLIVAELYQGRLRLITHDREKVQLGSGLSPDGVLTPDAQERALQCLKRFGQHTRLLPRAHVAAVGTHAFRAARNMHEFLSKAQEALGHRIDIISGEQEAQLIYEGVFYTCGRSSDHRMVIDIGGGSTEVVIGQEEQPLLVNSLSLGCLRMAQPSFVLKEDPYLWPEASFQKAYREACEILAPLRPSYRRLGWKECWGTAGSLDAILQILMAYEWATEPRFTARGLEKLRRRLSDRGPLHLSKISGLTPERANVFPAGLAILCALFDVFEIDEIRYATGGLREGLLYQLLQQHGQDASHAKPYFA